MSDISGTESKQSIGESASCAFCEKDRQYVLTVVDPTPAPEKVIEDVTDLPVCEDHTDQIREGAL